jgi:2-polyprenyl-3-methyl-5-hydroxy-6-metoxy-1,4-benzoquinol methylase
LSGALENKQSVHAVIPVIRPGAQRVCPSCGAAGALEVNQRLWPADWNCGTCGTQVKSLNGLVQLAPELDDINEGFDLDSFELLANVEDTHFWFVARNELIGWLVRGYAGSAQRVMEIGCGTGFVLNALRDALPNARITGSELHSQGLKTAKERHGDSVELIQMDARQSGLRSAIDLVGAFDVLEHIPDDDRVLREIFSMLRPGGRLIATVPQHPWMWSAADDLAHHQRRYKVGELAEKTQSAGFEPIYHSSFVTLAFPLMAASRILEKVSSKTRTLQDQHSSEFQIPPRVNAALLSTCRIEQHLRRMGCPLPFGGSQVLVAERPLGS